MTLQNGAIHDGTAYLWSDTAWFEHGTGRMIGTGPKTLHGVRWPWAVSTTLVGADTASFSDIVARVSGAMPRCSKNATMFNRRKMLRLKVSAKMGAGIALRV